jgi:hypothetical protein
MAKRRSSEWVSVLEDIEEEVPEPETVKLVLLKNLVLNITGPITGKVYHFSGPGSTLDVDKYDAEIMLKKRRTTPSCCGGYPSPYFDIAI